jgi:hypothetical protein
VIRLVALVVDRHEVVARKIAETKTLDERNSETQYS